MLKAGQDTRAPDSAAIPRLGELLINAGALTRLELDQAIVTQNREGGFLGQILVQMGFVKQSDVSSCLVKQCKIPHLSLLDYIIDKEVSLLVPQEICIKHHLLPIDRLGKILTVAMVDPLDTDALNAMRQACPELRIKPILCNWQHFELVCNRVFGIEVKKAKSGGGMSMESLGLGAAPRKAPPPKPAPEPEAVPSMLPTANEVMPPLDMSALTGAIQQSISQSMNEAVSALSARLGAEAQAQPVASPTPPTLEQLTQAVREGIGGALEEAVAEAVVQFRALMGHQAAGGGAEDVATAMREVFAEHRQAEDSRFQKLFDALGQHQHATPAQAPAAAEPSSTAPPPRPDSQDEDLRPFTSMTFQNFIGGKDNEFTLKLGEAAAREPGGKYNPVLLHGKVGVGKTHFMSAIGNRMLERQPEARVGLVSAAQFAAAFDEALRNGATGVFRQRHSQWDMLLLDDVQGFEGRTQALEEFLHLLNVLHQQGTQLIIASDKAPDALTALGRQAMSRLSSGVVVELKPPSWEARVDILRRAAESKSVEIPDEVLKLISMKVPEDMRMMLGALSKVAANGTLEGQPITYETAENVLKRLGAEVAA